MLSLPVRLLGIAALTAAPLVGTMALVSPAGAATPTTCTTLVAKVSSERATLKGCTASTTGGSGVLSKDKGVKKTDLVTWANGGTTTFKVSTSEPPTDKCPSGKLEDQLNSKVLASTGAASGVTGKVSVSFCFPKSAKGKVTLLPGTVWKF
jgi:hypothetical protein